MMLTKTNMHMHALAELPIKPMKASETAQIVSAQLGPSKHNIRTPISVACPESMLPHSTLSFLLRQRALTLPTLLQVDIWPSWDLLLNTRHLNRTLPNHNLQRLTPINQHQLRIILQVHLPQLSIGAHLLNSPLHNITVMATTDNIPNRHSLRILHGSRTSQSTGELPSAMYLHMHQQPHIQQLTPTTTVLLITATLPVLTVLLMQVLSVLHHSRCHPLTPNTRCTPHHMALCPAVVLHLLCPAPAMRGHQNVRTRMASTLRHFLLSQMQLATGSVLLMLSSARLPPTNHSITACVRAVHTTQIRLTTMMTREWMTWI